MAALPALALGAVKVGCETDASDNVTAGPEICVHAKPAIEPSSEELEPSRTTWAPSLTIWSGPASGDGRRVHI